MFPHLPAQVVEQHRRLPPLLNDRALFTRASPFNDKQDPSYHSPSNRIAANYSPVGSGAAAVLFEHFPKVCSVH
jgi:dynein heavy chain, axonemal